LKVSFYDSAGRFTQTLEGDVDLVITPTAQVIGLPYVEGDYGSDHWFHNGEPQLRPTCPTTLDGLTLHNVPANSTININDQTYDCEDGGTVELDFDQPGTYRIRITSWPYLDGEFTYENPAQ